MCNGLNWAYCQLVIGECETNTSIKYIKKNVNYCPRNYLRKIIIVKLFWSLGSIVLELKYIFINTKFFIFNSLANVSGALVNMTRIHYQYIKNLSKHCAGRCPHTSLHASVPAPPTRRKSRNYQSFYLETKILNILIIYTYILTFIFSFNVKLLFTCKIPTIIWGFLFWFSCLWFKEPL
jgi:hypothetical protein